MKLNNFISNHCLLLPTCLLTETAPMVTAASQHFSLVAAELARQHLHSNLWEFFDSACTSHYLSAH